jgi:membrane-associated protease RseP (regulator of RpoE activity)
LEPADHLRFIFKVKYLFQHSTKEYSFHGLLFLLTFATTVLAGVYWANQDPLELTNLPNGLPYGILILVLLGSHEMGHYVAARVHSVSATLPYFLPFPSFVGLIPFGTLGAVIKLKSTVTSRKVLFDIGASGPIAGFLVSLVLLIIGFTTLPPINYLYAIHPEYSSLSSIPEGGLRFGNTILFSLLAGGLPSTGTFVPPMNEIYHYPFLCVGWFGLLVTAMNLIPVGQLDGGHIAVAALGRLALPLARVSLLVLIALGIGGILPVFGIAWEWGWPGWLLWAIVLLVFTRGLRRSPAYFEKGEPIGQSREVIAALCALIFLLSFPITPFSIQLP